MHEATDHSDTTTVFLTLTALALLTLLILV